VRQKHISDLLIFHNDSVNIPFSFEKVTRYEHMKFCLFSLAHNGFAKLRFNVV
jgi:hypothetical protein